MAFKTKRLNLRLTRQKDALLRSAAVARGESAHDFVLRRAAEAAEIELTERSLFVIDDAAWTQLLELLSTPPALPEALVKLLSTTSVLERSA